MMVKIQMTWFTEQVITLYKTDPFKDLNFDNIVNAILQLKDEAAIENPEHPERSEIDNLVDGIDFDESMNILSPVPEDKKYDDLIEGIDFNESFKVLSPKSDTFNSLTDGIDFDESLKLESPKSEESESIQEIVQDKCPILQPFSCGEPKNYEVPNFTLDAEDLFKTDDINLNFDNNLQAESLGVQPMHYEEPIVCDFPEFTLNTEDILHTDEEIVNLECMDRFLQEAIFSEIIPENVSVPFFKPN